MSALPPGAEGVKQATPVGNGKASDDKRRAAEIAETNRKGAIAKRTNATIKSRAKKAAPAGRRITKI
jgi:hypothetical protein